MKLYIIIIIIISVRQYSRVTCLQLTENILGRALYDVFKANLKRKLNRIKKKKKKEVQY